MGFFSYKCCVSNETVPAYPWAERPKKESEVVLLCPDGTKIEGVYDGYGNINDNAVAVGPYFDPPRWVKKKYYTDQTYEQLPPAKRCEFQGFFY